ncbi:hypothetical protein E3T50_04045 [Cryobacterium gelidum]|uniref:Uncharacterized protein n=1 Tax=Cryobacterium gelidum TaxID=1259164 RepID=A0A4R9AYH4_9MICO|nr:hypothetical protein E3T50_04045 [Cryobacterium gelidum]
MNATTTLKQTARQTSKPPTKRRHETRDGSLRLARARQSPVAYRFGKHLKFAISDVRSWMAQQREPSHRPSRRRTNP